MTVTYSDTTLTDTASQINSGTAIEMNCTTIRYDVGAAIQVPQYPGKEVGVLTHNTLLAKGDFIGFHNPVIAIEGYIEVDSTASNLVTLRFLQQMMESGNKMTLSDKYDTDTPYYRISGLTGTFPNDSVTTITVIAKGLHIETSTQLVKEGRVLKYTLTVQEVQT